jgi:hypothetical protein
LMAMMTISRTKRLMILSMIKVLTKIPVR